MVKRDGVILEKDKEEDLNLSISILRSLAGVLLSIATAAMPCSL